MILIVSNSRDFATDHVVAALRGRGSPYLRLDLDLLATEGVFLDPVAPRLVIDRPGRRYDLGPDAIRAVYYRAPTHLCESGGGRYPPEELLARHQWAAFARSLTVFDRPRWVNHPGATYRAENKPYQLRVAREVGFSVPATRVCNAVPAPADGVWDGSGRAAVKAVDTFLTRVGPGEDAFFYTQAVRADDLGRYSLAEMPVTVQRLIEPKLDLRVTVVGERVFPVAVVAAGAGVVGDWRLVKDRVDYSPHPLPPEVAAACVALVRRLGLVFGAIDLALSGGTYYFLEVNPTGEWAWLEDRLGLPLAEAITDALRAG